MKSITKNFHKGLMFGILVGIAWGLDGVLMGNVGLHRIFTDQSFALSKGLGELSFQFSPLVTAFFHESFCFLWVAIFLVLKKQIKHVFYLLFKTKKGRAVALAALVGSPIGMSAYLLAIKFASAPYASSISVVYPGVGAILSYLILKEKLNKRAIIGISISLLGSFMLGFNPTTLVPQTFFKGIMFAVVAVFGWASEGVILGMAMKHIKDEDHIDASPQQFLCLRYFIAMVSYALIVIPVIKGYPMVTEIIKNGLVLKYAAIAILGAITYLSWYKAVDLIGPAMGTALNSTAAFWVIVFNAILFKGEVTLSLAGWCLVIILGVTIFALSSNEKKVEG